MLKTHLGPVEEDAAVVYLRPETAQGIYVNFKNVQATSQKLPFGIAQIGKAFRNEISPGNFVFRMREFEQMEMQYFVRPDGDRRLRGMAASPARVVRALRRDPVAASLPRAPAGRVGPLHAKEAIDVEYRFRSDGRSSRAFHSRGDFDLGNHAKASGENLGHFDPATEEHFIPWIIETSAGGDRAPFTFLIDAYEREVRGENVSRSRCSRSWRRTRSRCSRC